MFREAQRAFLGLWLLVLKSCPDLKLEKPVSVDPKAGGGLACWVSRPMCMPLRVHGAFRLQGLGSKKSNFKLRPCALVRGLGRSSPVFERALHGCCVDSVEVETVGSSGGFRVQGSRKES